jgi:NAD(P)-dependent dehydrogenase (short-subunit alcohol dehydrogenase family)
MLFSALSTISSRTNSANMASTVIITGATGSLALEAVQQLLSSHPSLTIVGTVRNATKSPKGPHLLRLEEMAHRYPSSKLLIKSVDLNSISEVRAFSDEIAGLVESNELPRISAIICNAFTWSLEGQQFSKDSMESTFQVNHLSHFLLVLKLLRSMDPETGRVVMLSSEVHDPEHPNAFSKLGAELPSDENLDSLIKPGADEAGTEHDMGWRRYANSKLANVMFMRSLNRRLQQVWATFSECEKIH